MSLQRCFGDRYTDLILTPMWAHIRIENVVPTQSCVGDFRRIRYEDRLMTWMDFNKMHYRCFHFLNDSIRRSAAAHIVVVSHYLPSSRLLSPEFIENPLNGAFATDLDGFHRIRSGRILVVWTFSPEYRLSYRKYPMSFQSAGICSKGRTSWFRPCEIDPALRGNFIVKRICAVRSGAFY